MEVKEKITPAWLDESHPNYERWKRARSISKERGKFVVSIIEKKIKCSGLTVLDLGSGQGGTATVLSENNNLFSLDIDKTRLNFQKDFDQYIFRINGDALNVPLKDDSFDLIILQDVIEHLQNPELIISVLYNLLKKDGILYLSTPNKYSIFNFFTDPHWGLPFVSILRRKTIKEMFLKSYRKSEYKRRDIAQLVSLKELQKLFDDKFEYKLHTKYSVNELFNGNKGIVWSDFHLKILKLLKALKLDGIVRGISNDKQGFINKFINPTFYFTLKKL
ncbi:MAG TPA: class I SAM-dependent methyltransferase [Ignavibacteriaceae bacterium]|nr:class I SAM-dependent methyltransferase [Ignavibacteriaceae bacterium]